MLEYIKYYIIEHFYSDDIIKKIKFLKMYHNINTDVYSSSKMIYVTDLNIDIAISIQNIDIALYSKLNFINIKYNRISLAQWFTIKNKFMGDIKEPFNNWLDKLFMLNDIYIVDGYDINKNIHFKNECNDILKVLFSVYKEYLC